MYLLFREIFSWVIFYYRRYDGFNLLMKIIIVLLLVVVLCDGQQTCTDNLRWPAEISAQGSTFSGYATEDTDTDSGYLMEAVEYLTPDDCTCGVVYKWIFHPLAAGQIEFQVWEHLEQQSYQLKGENYFTVPAGAVGETIEFPVPQRDRITIRNNHLIGWYGATSGIIGYQEGVESYSDEARRQSNMSNLDPAHEPTFDWTSGSSVVFPDRKYAIGAEVISNTAPEFTNLPREVWIYGDETAAAYIYQISASDIDPKDVSSLFVYDTAEEPTSNFYFDRVTKTVNLAVSKPAIGTYTMTFEVQDQCLNTNQGVLTIKVLNWAPSLTNLPSFATISEVTDHEVALFIIQFTDKDNTTLAQQSLTVTPASSDISLKNVGHDEANRSVVSADGASYSYTTAQQYIISLTLGDGETDTDTGYFMLYITKNDPPKFTNLENGAQANISYVTTAAGDTVYAVSVTDAENDALTFTMACVPAGCPLEIDGDNGVISAKQDFVGNISVPGWDLAITVYDGYTTVGPKSVSVLVHDINDVPQIVNLGLANPIAVHEGTALGTVIYTVSYVDLDTTDTHTFHATYNPSWAANYFEMNITSGVLSTAHNILDYEELDPNWTVDVTITVSDGIDRSVPGILSILIRNINEAPYFHQTKYTLEPPEEGTFGTTAGDWRPGLNDPDLDITTPLDTHAYTWDCGVYTRYFRIDRTTGAVTYAIPFDYDDVNFTSPYDCVVTVTDRAGLTATTTLEIDIHDENDNDPVFVTTTDNYIFQIPSLDPGRLVGQVTATDKDRTTHNSRIYYSFHTTPFTKDYLLINDYGNIYVNETWVAPQFGYGISYELIVKAENVKDTSGTVRSATATVTLFLSGTTTTAAVTTDRPFKFVEDNRNVAWMAVLLAFGVVLLVIVCGFMMMYTVQIKRYRWCVPWIRKHLLGLRKLSRRQKRRYYRGLLMQEELDEMDEDSDEEPVNTVLPPGHGDSDEENSAPPMLWDRLKARGDPITRGPTVRKPNIPQAAVYDEPKPKLKKSVSEIMKEAKSKFWT